MIWDLLLVISGAWLCYRAYLIYLIPREELEEKLGWDIPPAPEASIAGIKSTSVLLFWINSQESQSMTIKHSIEVNGIKVGDFGRGQTAIEITGLRPGDCYNIRVLALNSANVISSGPFIRIQTLPVHDSGVDFASTIEPHVDDVGEAEAAAIRTTSPPFESAASQPLARDLSEAQRFANRNSPTRRSGHASDNLPQDMTQSGADNEDGSSENIQRLTYMSESLKRQKEETDRQVEEEEVEARTNHAELAKERERLRQALREREDLSAELRKQGNHLEKANRSAQSKKAAKEKQLLQKRAERQRLRDEIVIWDKEMLDMAQDNEEMNAELAEVNERKDDDIAGIRAGIVEDLNANRFLEDEIRVKAAEIKVLEEGKEQMGAEGVEEQERAKRRMEREEALEMNYQALQGQVGSMWQTLQQAKLDIQQSKETLHWWVDKRAGNLDQFAPIPALDFPPYVHRKKSRKIQQTNSRHSTVSSPSYQAVSTAQGVPAAPSPYPTAFPFFNSNNCIAVPLEPDEAGHSQPEAEALIGEALMSPAASQLLPSNLLGEEDLANPRSTGSGRWESVGRSGNDTFLKHALSISDASLPAPQTPSSPDSPAGSAFSSPHDSLPSLQRFQSTQDAFGDNYQDSAIASSAPLHDSLMAESNALATSRLATLFSSPFSRQRGKTSTQDAPMLGTLKQGQSQSFPRNFESDTINPAGSRRRRGSHARTSSGRSSRLNMFKPKFDALESPVFSDKTSSRPSSTYSHDQLYGRPSSESQRLWWPVSEAIQNRNRPLGANWASSTGPWSHVPSRRASMQHNSTTNLSIGSTPLEPDEMTGPLSKQRSEQAPIGTRPKSSQRPATPKLNPTAPTFKTLFRGKLERSTGKASETSKDKDAERMEAEDYEPTHEASTPTPRLSRDAQSITTATSIADSHDSFERSISGTPSETIQFGQKESLMQKITRKSSSSKFNVPWSKDRGIFAKKAGEPSTH